MTGEVRLREVAEADLPIFYESQRDPHANWMAAVAPRDRDAFMAHWAKILGDATSVIRTIVVDGEVAGNVLSFEHSGEREVGYWLGKDYYGRGIATRALSAFLEQFRVRPLHAHVAKHNRASVRVLEKCGFKLVGEEKSFATLDGEAIEGFVLKLEPTEGDA